MQPSRSHWPAVLGFGLVVALLFAVSVCREELLIRQLSSEAKWPGGGPTIPLSARACHTHQNPRALLACGVLQLKLASFEQSGQGRDAALRNAMALSDRLRDRQPRSAGASILRSLAAAELGHSRDAMLALQESYRQAPYLRDFALARISLAAHSANRLDGLTRHAMLSEAIWMARQGRSQRSQVLNALAGTDSYITVTLRLPGNATSGLPL